MEYGSFLWEGDLIEGLGIRTAGDWAGKGGHEALMVTAMVFSRFDRRQRDGFSSYVRLL